MRYEWKDCTLGDAITLKRGYDLPSKERRLGTVPIVSSAGVSDFHSDAIVKGPGVVTGRYGTIGQVFYLSQDFWPLNTTLYVQDFKGNDRRFVSYLLRTVDYHRFSDKAAVPGVNRNHLHTARIALPPLAEQERIAEVLYSLDERIDLLRQTNATLEAIARALFKSWFVDFNPVRAKMEGRELEGMDAATAAMFADGFEESELGEIPKGWRVASFGDALEIIGGGTPKTNVAEYWGGDIPWFSVVDTPSASDVFVIATEKNITLEGLKRSAAHLVSKGTTIISARGTVGNLAVASRDLTFNQSCYGLRGKNGAGDYFVFLTAQRMVKKLLTMAHGSVFSTITRQTFDAIHITVPPEKLFLQFEQAVSACFDKILLNAQQSLSLAQLRDTLLPRLISGKLRLPDALAQVEEAVS